MSRDRHYFEEGPPSFTRFMFVLVMVIGGLTAAVVYNVREIPTASAQETRQTLEIANR